MLAASVLLSTLCASPQGGLNRELPPHLRPRLDYPDDVVAAEVAPFRDTAGQPERVATLAVDAGDFDGDGNPEAWFLGGTGRPGEVAIQMPQTADLGRFLPYGLMPAGNYVAGATYHTTTAPTDFVMLADPGASSLFSLFYVPPTSGNPRRGTWVIQPMIWSVGYHAYELQTADHDGDGHDDIMALAQVTSSGVVVGTTVVKLRMGTSQGFLDHESSVILTVPAVLEKLRMLDLDGDGLSDFVAHAPGLGVVAYRDDGNGNFVFHDYVPIDANLLRDLFVGEADDDGRDDFGLVFDIGTLVCASRPTGLHYTALLAPPDMGALAAARFVNAYGEPDADVVAFPRDGRNFVIHPYDPIMRGYREPVVQKSPADTEPLGPQNPGVTGESVLVADLDNDYDLDVLLQRPTGAGWVTLYGPLVDLRPLTVKVQSLGPVGSIGFVAERFTVFLPDAFFALGITELEMGVFLEDPFTQQQVYWHRLLLTPDVQTKSVTFLVNVMTDPRNLGFLFGPPRYTMHTNGGITAGGPTVLTLHGKIGTKRVRSDKFSWDGQPDGNGSAVGVRWRVVAAPPLPIDDAQLLPWN